MSSSQRHRRPPEPPATWDTSLNPQGYTRFLIPIGYVLPYSLTSWSSAVFHPRPRMAYPDEKGSILHPTGKVFTAHGQLGWHDYSLHPSVISTPRLYPSHLAFIPVRPRNLAIDDLIPWPWHSPDPSSAILSVSQNWLGRVQAQILDLRGVVDRFNLAYKLLGLTPISVLEYNRVIGDEVNSLLRRANVPMSMEETSAWVDDVRRRTYEAHGWVEMSWRSLLTQLAVVSGHEPPRFVSEDRFLGVILDSDSPERGTLESLGTELARLGVPVWAMKANDRQPPLVILPPHPPSDDPVWMSFYNEAPSNVDPNSYANNRIKDWLQQRCRDGATTDARTWWDEERPKKDPKEPHLRVPSDNVPSPVIPTPFVPLPLAVLRALNMNAWKDAKAALVKVGHEDVRSILSPKVYACSPLPSQYRLPWIYSVNAARLPALRSILRKDNLPPITLETVERPLSNVERHLGDFPSIHVTPGGRVLAWGSATSSSEASVRALPTITTPLSLADRIGPRVESTSTPVPDPLVAQVPQVTVESLSESPLFVPPGLQSNPLAIAIYNSLSSQEDEGGDSIAALRALMAPSSSSSTRARSESAAGAIPSGKRARVHSPSSSLDVPSERMEFGGLSYDDIWSGYYGAKGATGPTSLPPVDPGATAPNIDGCYWIRLHDYPSPSFADDPIPADLALPFALYDRYSFRHAKFYKIESNPQTGRQDVVLAFSLEERVFLGIVENQRAAIELFPYGHCSRVEILTEDTLPPSVKNFMSDWSEVSSLWNQLVDGRRAARQGDRVWLMRDRPADFTTTPRLRFNLLGPRQDYRPQTYARVAEELGITLPPLLPVAREFLTAGHAKYPSGSYFLVMKRFRYDIKVFIDILEDYEGDVRRRPGSTDADRRDYTTFRYNVLSLVFPQDGKATPVSAPIPPLGNFRVWCEDLARRFSYRALSPVYSDQGTYADEMFTIADGREEIEITLLELGRSTSLRDRGRALVD